MPDPSLGSEMLDTAKSALGLDQQPTPRATPEIIQNLAKQGRLNADFVSRMDPQDQKLGFQLLTPEEQHKFVHNVPVSKDMMPLFPQMAEMGIKAVPRLVQAAKGAVGGAAGAGLGGYVAKKFGLPAWMGEMLGGGIGAGVGSGGGHGAPAEEPPAGGSLMDQIRRPQPTMQGPEPNPTPNLHYGGEPDYPGRNMGGGGGQPPSPPGPPSNPPNLEGPFKSPDEIMEQVTRRRSVSDLTGSSTTPRPTNPPERGGDMKDIMDRVMGGGAGVSGLTPRDVNPNRKAPSLDKRNVMSPDTVADETLTPGGKPKVRRRTPE